MHLVAILVTPNCILEMDDVPPDPGLPFGRSVQPNVQSPNNVRYILQWLAPFPSDMERFLLGPRRDAAFRAGTTEPMPSVLLLAYIYGATAVKRFGHNANEVLSVLFKPELRRPEPRKQPLIDPSRTVEEGAHTRKRRRTGDNRERSVEGQGIDFVAEVGRHLDEWDLVLLLSSRNPSTQERLAQERESFRNRIHQWACVVADSESTSKRET